MCHKCIFIALLLALIAGCSSSTSQNTTQNQTDASAADQAATQEKTTPRVPPPPASSAISTAAEQKPAQTTSKAKSEPASPKPAPGMTLEKAQAGSGDKGRGYEPGVITTPVAVYFTARERIMFEIQIPALLQDFEFQNNRSPKSNEEFMEKVIKKNNIQLPSLPPNSRYVYDPKEKQLMVEKPQ